MSRKIDMLFLDKLPRCVVDLLIFKCVEKKLFFFSFKINQSWIRFGNISFVKFVYSFTNQLIWCDSYTTFTNTCYLIASNENGQYLICFHQTFNKSIKIIIHQYNLEFFFVRKRKKKIPHSDVWMRFARVKLLD